MGYCKWGNVCKLNHCKGHQGKLTKKSITRSRGSSKIKTGCLPWKKLLYLGSRGSIQPCPTPRMGTKTFGLRQAVSAGSLKTRAATSSHTLGAGKKTAAGTASNGGFTGLTRITNWRVRLSPLLSRISLPA